MSAPCQNSSSFLWTKQFVFVSYQVDTSLKLIAIDNNLNDVPFNDFADWSTGKSFRANMTNACSRGNPGKPGICQNGNVLAEREMFQRRSNLINLFHSCAGGSSANQDQNVSGFDPIWAVALDGCNRVLLSNEDPCWPDLPIDSV